MKKETVILFFIFFVLSCKTSPIIEDIEGTSDKKHLESEVIDETNNDEIKWKLPRNIELGDVERRLNEQRLKFSIDLFKVAQKECVDKNFVISPYSTAIALSMLANGADGNTANELNNLLLDESSTLDDLNEYNHKIASEFVSLDNFTQFEVTNALFANIGLELVPQFVDYNRRFYNSPITTVDFSKPIESTMTLNKWIENATHGLIKEMLIKNNISFLVANAVYFRSSWEKYFDKSKTINALFYNYDKTASTVKMMEGHNYNFSIDGRYVVIGLPYGNRSFSMYIAYNYEDQVDSLKGIESILTFEKIKGYILRDRQGLGYVKLPRFEVSNSDVNINALLKKMGVIDLFSNQSDLSRLFKDNKISSTFLISHDCVLGIDESGTVGASNTMIHMCTSPGEITEPINFTVDHPFVFWIAEKSTGTILFMGQINKLEDAKE
ncbi:MAG: serpin family protein [Muribaculaceae bacterium]|nr:serpin family protein [Muribaculaceae bacterium]